MFKGGLYGGKLYAGTLFGPEGSVEPPLLLAAYIMRLRRRRLTRR